MTVSADLPPAARIPGRERLPAIRLEGVSKRYGDVVALGKVDLEIPIGEFFTLLGPSGSGKSTLLQMIAGFEKPTTGRIFLGEEDVTDLPANRRSTNTVFQSLALFPHMTVARNVEYGLKIAGMNKAERAERRRSMLMVVGLEGLDDRTVHQLSGGQRQRVALARALVMEPKVLLLDEPLTGLDEKFRQQMQVEIKQLHGRLKATFLSVTHNQEEAVSMSDRIAVLRDGIIEQVGTPREIYEEPVNGFVADFMGAENLLIPTSSPSPLASASRMAGGTKLVRFGLADAEITAVAPACTNLAATLAAVIRPEAIAVGEAAEGLPNTITANVIERTYKGRETMIELELQDGQRVRAVYDAKSEAVAPTVGTRVTLGWAPEAMRLLPTGR